LFDNNKNVVCNLAKANLGEENSRFLGSLLLSYVYLLMQEREFSIPDEHLRPKLTLFVDELQNYVTETIADMLGELRKYGLRMVAGHQFRSQFDDEKVKEGVYQLSRTKIFFDIGETDALFFESVVTPRFTASDLTSLEKYWCVIKLCIDDYEQPAFTLKTLPPLYPYREETAMNIIEKSRKEFYAGKDALNDIQKRYEHYVRDEDDEKIPSVQIGKSAAVKLTEMHAPSQDKTSLVDVTSSKKITLILDSPQELALDKGGKKRDKS